MDFCGVFFLFEFSLASGNDKVGCIVRVVPFATDFPIPSPEPFLINWTQENRKCTNGSTLITINIIPIVSAGNIGLLGSSIIKHKPNNKLSVKQSEVRNARRSSKFPLYGLACNTSYNNNNNNNHNNNKN